MLDRENFMKEFAEVTANEERPDLPDEIIDGRGDLLFIINELTHSKLTVKELNDAYTFLAGLLLGNYPKIAFAVPQDDRIRLSFAELDSLPSTKGKLTIQEKLIFAFCVFFSVCISFYDKESGQIKQGIKYLTSTEKVINYLNWQKEKHPEKFKFLDSLSEQEESSVKTSFAISPDNPVKAINISAGYNYLNNLYTLDGEKVKYNRIGSMIRQNGKIIDAYMLSFKSGGEDKTMKIYIDPYSAENSMEAPAGLVFKEYSAEELFKQGMTAYNSGVNIREVFRLLNEAAQKGHTEAKFTIGLFLSDMGNYQEAMKWYREAANEGNLMALNNIALMYSKGLGVEQDYSEAMKFYTMAAEKGLPAAEHNVGIYYASGNLGRQNLRKAIHWWNKAALHGYKISQEEMSRVLAWLRQSGEQGGNSESLCILGELYEKGEGVPQDMNQAIKFYKLAAEQNNENALKNLRRLGKI